VQYLEAARNLPAFSRRDWGHRNSEQNTNVRTIRSKKGDFGQPHNKEDSEYLGRERNAALGKYEVKAGWLIPAVLEQQLNSDLPGLIRGLVRENVYDTVSGKYILIPAGSTLVGIYNSHVGYGQKAFAGCLAAGDLSRR